MNPATPGFLVTLTATILLALVSFNTPIIKSIDFIKASFSESGVDATGVSGGGVNQCEVRFLGTPPKLGHVDRLYGERQGGSVLFGAQCPFGCRSLRVSVPDLYAAVLCEGGG